MLEQLVIVVGLGLAGAAAVGATLAAVRHHGRMVHGRLAAAVQPLGLQLTSEPLGSRARAAGTIEGLEVEVRYVEPPKRSRREQPIDPTAEVRVEIALPGRMPAGQRVLSQGWSQEVLIALGAQDVQLGDEGLDPLVRVISDDPDATRELLLSPGVASALRACAGNLRTALDLQGNRLVVRETAPIALDPGPAVALAVRLGRALVDAFDAPWVTFAAGHGLSLAGTFGPGNRTLAGRIDEVEVKVVLGSERDDQDRPQTRIVATISPPLPGEVRFRGRARGAVRSGLATGDPVVDSVLDVQAVDPAAARRLLADEAVTGLLLEVLHGHPGSYVHPRGVVLVAPGWLRDRLGPTVETAVGLARALQRAAS